MALQSECRLGSEARSTTVSCGTQSQIVWLQCALVIHLKNVEKNTHTHQDCCKNET